MKPEFEKYRGERKTPKEITAARLPADLKAEAELIAAAEDDSLTGLLIEGIARVIEDRRSDPDYSSSIRLSLEAQAQDLETQLAATQKLLGNFTAEPGQA